MFQASEAENEEARTAFQSVLVVRTGISDNLNTNFSKFSARVKNISAEVFGYSYAEEVSVTVAQFYDAALLYCHALYPLLRAGGGALGAEIFAGTRGVTVEGITGPVTINNNGDRLGEAEQ